MMCTRTTFLSLAADSAEYALTTFKCNLSDSDYKTNASFDFVANYWVPEILAPVGFWGKAASTVMGRDNKAGCTSASLDEKPFRSFGNFAWKTSFACLWVGGS
jgi:hypothetical protein